MVTISYQLCIKYANLFMSSRSSIYVLRPHLSKDFDKVQYKRVIFKLRQNDISSNYFRTFNDLFKLRKQKVVVNGQLSSWPSMEAGVPQGSILKSFLFFIYMDNLSDGLSTNSRLFAGDFSFVRYEFEFANHYFSYVTQWRRNSLGTLIFTPNKTIFEESITCNTHLAHSKHKFLRKKFFILMRRTIFQTKKYLKPPEITNFLPKKTSYTCEKK